VKTFTFHQDTVNPGLTEATYKIEHLGDTGRIYSADSLRYGTRIDSVVPYITYKATPRAVYFVLPDTTITHTGSDTLDFTQSPIYLHVISSDFQNKQWYKFDIHVHQADPDLFVWEKLNDQIFPAQNCETKAFMHKGQLLLLLNNGLSTQAYQSADGEKWSTLASQITSLPSRCYVRDILQHGDSLYYIADNSLYHSIDAINWQKTDNTAADYVLLNMLVSYNNHAWCLVQNTDGDIQLATVTPNQVTIMQQMSGLTEGKLPANFPVSDFAALSFQTSSERPRAMIVGGRDIQGDAVNTRWNLEYTSGAYRLRDFSTSQPQFETLVGASIIQYNKQLLMFGGTNLDVTLQSDILYSDDEGMNWYTPDSAQNQLPSTYVSRYNQSVITDDKHNIYIIGGRTKTETLGDIYRGYLNSAKWQ
jgi:hypothetical protein